MQHKGNKEDYYVGHGIDLYVQENARDTQDAQIYLQKNF